MSLSMDFNCPQAKWQSIRKAASAKGVEIPDTQSDEVEHKGVRVRFWRYGDMLHAEVVKLPWKYKFVPESLIIAKVKELFEQV